MEARAIAKYVRVSPRKMKPIADLVRGKNVKEALAILKYTPRKGARVFLKVMKSAVANAENNHNLDPDNLYVSETFANPGPIQKRMMPRAQGRGFRINKRTSHITIVVKEKE